MVLVSPLGYLRRNLRFFLSLGFFFFLPFPSPLLLVDKILILSSSSSSGSLYNKEYS
jgi:hypothetical protein